METDGPMCCARAVAGHWGYPVIPVSLVVDELIAAEHRDHLLLTYVSVYCNTTCISPSPGTPAWLMLNAR